MSAPKCKASPTIMHANAVLKVCARAQDMDSLWDIVSKLPERGSHAANSWTYTTILNTLRMNTILAGPVGEAGHAMARRREQAIVEGRRLWNVVITRWRAGDLVLDEELVCSMGRLLLIGSRPRDWDDVLSLVQQTMNISRLVPRLGTAARQDVPIPRIRAPYTPADMKNDDSEIVDEYDEPKPGSEFDLFDTHKSINLVVGRGRSSSISPRDAHAYAVPKNSSLSLLTEACLKMVIKKPAQNYWALLTDSYGVKPDLDNIHMMLRVLRQSRSSAEALEMLREEMPRLGVVPLNKTLRIAMSVCVRDGLNPNIFENAQRVLDVMQNALSEPDIPTMNMFLEIANKSPDSAVLTRALERMEPGVVNVRSLLNFGREHIEQRGGVLDPKDKENAFELIQRMIGLYDRLLLRAEQPLEGEMRRTFEDRRGKLAAFLTRKKLKMEEWVAARDKARQEKEKARQETEEAEGKKEQALSEEEEGEEDEEDDEKEER